MHAVYQAAYSSQSCLSTDADRPAAALQVHAGIFEVIELALLLARLLVQLLAQLLAPLLVQLLAQLLAPLLVQHLAQLLAQLLVPLLTQSLAHLSWLAC